LVAVAVRHRERRARRSQAREGARRDRVVDPESFAVEELQVGAELHARNAGGVLLTEIAWEVLEVGDADRAGRGSRLRAPLACGGRVVAVLGVVAVRDEAAHAELAVDGGS